MKMWQVLILLLIALIVTPARARDWPLWDGHQSVDAYAKSVNLPPTKSLDLGNGVTLDLVLIPPGKFIMGTPEPVKPGVTVEGSIAMIVIGGVLTIGLFIYLRMRFLKVRKRIFSLGWLLLLTATVGIFIGGIARGFQARDLQDEYAREDVNYTFSPQNEKPAHPVTITQPFYLGKFSVTQEQYFAVTGNHPSTIIVGVQLPVIDLSWIDAKVFCETLNKRLPAQALNARLPSEAQWEYACRAGTQTTYYSGNRESDLDDVAWNSNNSKGTPHPVGQKRPNAFGLYDMLGNVWNWCEDVYSEKASGSETAPTTVDGSSARLLRGGSWLGEPSICRAAYRGTRMEHYQDFNVGFRILIPVPEQKAP